MLFTIYVSQHQTVSRLQYLNEEMANSAYGQIKTAMTEFKRFKNDNAEIIEVLTQDGKASFKVEELQNVMIGGGDPEDFILAKIEEAKRERAMYEAAGIPYPEKGGRW